MSAFVLPLEDWLVHSALAGGAVLLAGIVLMPLTRQPARRQRLGELALASSVLTAGLCILPSWLPCPVPLWSAAAVDDAVVDPMEGEEALLEPLEFVYVYDLEGEPQLTSMPEYPDQAYLAATVPLRRSQHDGAEMELLATARTVPGAIFPGWRAVLECIAWIYLAAVGLLTCRFLLGCVGLCRLIRRSERVPGRVQAIYDELTRDWKRPPRLLACPRLALPVSFGIWHPTILVPSGFCRRHAEEKLRWVLVHELTHLERWDAFGCLLTAFGQALYFYQPWFWWLRRQIRLCQEYIADAAAAAHGSSEDYAQYLVSLSTYAPQPLPAGARVTGVLGSPSDLFRRITMLLETRRDVEKHCPRWWSVAATAGFAAVAILVSGLSLRAEEPKKEVKREIILKKAADTKDDVSKEKEQERQKKIIVVSPEKDGVIRELKAIEGGPVYRFEVIQDGEVLKGEAALKGVKVYKEEELEKVQAALKKALQSTEKGGGDKNLQEIRKQLEELQERINALQKEVDVRSKEAKVRIETEVIKSREQAEKAKEKAVKALEGKQELFARTLTVPRGHLSLLHGGGARLGVMLAPPSDALAAQLDLSKGRGIVVEKVLPDSAASKAGIKEHDIIVEFAGQPVSSKPEEFIKAVDAVKAEKAVQAVVLRKGQKVPIKDIELPPAKVGAGQYLHLQDLKTIPPRPPTPQFKLAPLGERKLVAPAGDGGSVVTTTVRNNAKITLRHQEGSLAITLTGSVEDGKVKIGSIAIDDGGNEKKFEKVESVPEQYRDKVKNLIEAATKGVHVEVKRSSPQ